MPDIEEIKRRFVADQFELSFHATGQSVFRQISIQEVREAVAAGEIIEDYPTDKYGPSCLLLGFTLAGRALHIQCTYPLRPTIKVITLYEPALDCGLITKLGKERPMNEYPPETMIDSHVTYTIEYCGKFYIIENVPARICVETGEQFFSPATVERLQQKIWSGEQPARTIETPVFDFAA